MVFTKEKQFAVDLAKKAGAIMKANFMLGMKKEWKADDTPVTKTDLTINQLVLDSVRQQFSEHDVLSEEGSNLRSGSNYVWVCDPVDGTIPFSHGIPTCVFALALVHDGVPILGVVYDPFLERLFFAEKNKGAFLNDVRISVSHEREFKKSLVGLSHWKGAQFDFSGLAVALQNTEAKVMNLGSTIYVGMLVGAGEFVASMFPGETAHDAAVLKILIEEAGGKVTDVYGHEQRYDQDIKGYLASNGILHDELVALVRKTVKL